MNYIIHKRLKANTIGGAVNLPAQTLCYLVDNIICYDGKPICATTSQQAHEHFAVNDDGKGMQRGRLTSGIIAKLSKRDKHHQDRWDKVWDSDLCRPFKRPEHDDHWLWSHEFYQAKIEPLLAIARLVGAKEG